MTSFRFPAFIIPSALKELHSLATLSRSFGLLDNPKYKQTDLDIFYGHLTEDTIGLLEGIVAGMNASAGIAGTAGSAGAGGTSSSVTTNTVPRGKRTLDVGGGPGHFGRTFAQRDVEYYICEPDVGEMVTAGIKPESSARGSGLGLPFRDDAFDLTHLSNVAEHVPESWTVGGEMLRMTKPGGLAVYSYTTWYGPFGGHEMGTTHHLSSDHARRMYEKKYGKRPKNYFGEPSFKVGRGEGLKRACVVAEVGDCELLATLLCYHPWWVWWMVHVPVLCEFAVSNLVLALWRR